MKSPRLIYFLFFISGLASLIYEIIWGRQLVLIFGSTTNSLIATISAFLGGLALGSLIAGKFVDQLRPRQLLFGYSILELGVGLTALLSPVLFSKIKIFYSFFSDGTSVTASLLLIKFILTSSVILVPTTLMGATLPFLVRFLQSQELPGLVLSRLYTTNTFGGVIGVLFAGFVSIELFGLNQSLIIAATLNLLVSIVSLAIPTTKNQKINLKSSPLKFSSTLVLALLGFSISGFISIAYQILWTRVLTPTMGTMIYAFSGILAFYLFGIAFGSFLYPTFRRIVPSPATAFGFLQLSIGLTAIFSTLVLHKVTYVAPLELALRLFLPTLFFGLTFPATISLINQPQATGKTIGLSYAVNTIGAILGGYLASFFLIPYIGSTQSIVLLSIINFAMAFVFISIDQSSSWQKLTLLPVSFLLLTSTYLITNKSDRLLPFATDIPILESKIQKVPYLFLEDDVASVFAKSQSQHNQPLLVIDGVPTTHRVSLTKYMAHLPITLHPNPKEVLIIAFGMGNTYRSSLKHHLKTTAIELVPSVPKTYKLFHTDNLLNSPLGKVIINDGRNFAFLTHNKYDIVIIDPPPPFNTAGSTVLHSKEYYQDLIKNLNPGGLVNQWIYAYSSRQDDISMAIRTFIEVFPYSYAVQKKDSLGGIFMLGSLSPIDTKNLKSLLKNPVVFNDLQEFKDTYVSPDLEPLEIIGDRNSLLKILKNYPLITDTHPRTEYYLLRHRFTNAPTLTGTDLENFVNLLKENYRL